jgi:hypothetical protein
MMPDEQCLQEIWKHPSTTFFSHKIVQIANELDILVDRSNPKANSAPK